MQAESRRRKGLIFVAVLEGRNLASKDSNGLSDPYVIVKIGSVKYTTKINYGTLNPKFKGEIFPLYV